MRFTVVHNEVTCNDEHYIGDHLSLLVTYIEYETML